MTTVRRVAVPGAATVGSAFLGGRDLRPAVTYSAVQPPSIERIAPVIDLAESEARNTA